MKVMGEAKALDWIECLLHRRDFIPGTLDLLHLPRKRLSHTTRQKEGGCHLLCKKPKTVNDGGEGDMHSLKTCLSLLPSCHHGSAIPTTYKYNP